MFANEPRWAALHDALEPHKDVLRAAFPAILTNISEHAKREEKVLSEVLNSVYYVQEAVFDTFKNSMKYENS